MKKLLLLLACVTVLLGCVDKGKTDKNVIYKEPILSFGVPKSIIKTKEKRNYINGDANTLLYGESNYMIVYLFEKDILTTAGIILPLKTNMDDLIKFISSKYVYLRQDKGAFLWMSKDRKIGIGVLVGKDAISVVYIPIPDNAQSPTKAEDNINQQIELFKEKTKAIL